MKKKKDKKKRQSFLFKWYQKMTTSIFWKPQWPKMGYIWKHIMEQWSLRIMWDICQYSGFYKLSLETWTFMNFFCSSERLLFACYFSFFFYNKFVLLFVSLQHDFNQGSPKIFRQSTLMDVKVVSVVLRSAMFDSR